MQIIYNEQIRRPLQLKKIGGYILLSNSNLIYYYFFIGKKWILENSSAIYDLETLPTHRHRIVGA